MTEEQRYRQSTDMKRDEIKCLKGIWDTLIKIQEQLERQLKVPMVYADGMPYVGLDLSTEEKEIEQAKSYMSYSEFLNSPEAADHYKDANLFNGDSSDPK